MFCPNFKIKFLLVSLFQLLQKLLLSWYVTLFYFMFYHNGYILYYKCLETFNSKGKKKDQFKFLCVKTRKEFSLLIDGQKMHTILENTWKCMKYKRNGWKLLDINRNGNKKYWMFQPLERIDFVFLKERRNEKVPINHFN